MSQQTRTIPRYQQANTFSSWAFLYGGLMIGLLFCAAVFFSTYFLWEDIMGGHQTPVAHAAQIERHVQINLNIVLNQPGLQKDWPAYTPGTLNVPAHSLVTITIRNYDLGDTPLPNGSPFAKVQGVVGGVAYADGHAFTSLALEKVAHTFSIQPLGVNVPIPGDTATGKPYAEVRFTFLTGAAGTYYFRCFDPCGTGAIGWQGPMVTRGYMLGTFSAQG